MRELLIFLYATAIGFAAAGFAASFIQLLTRRPVAFNPPEGNGVLGYLAAVFRFAFIGPYIIARFALRAAVPPQKSIGILSGGLAVALLWSSCSGVLMLGVAVSVMNG